MVYESINMANYQTIYALSSGSLPSAIAVVRVSGPSTQKVLKLLVNKVPEPRKMILTEIKTPEHEVIDFSLICFFPKTQSVTGEDLAEFHLHGSVAVVEGLCLTLAAISDVRPAEAGEFTRRSLNNGKMGLTEVEALSDLIAAETQEQRKQSLRQLSGELSAKYEAWRKKLIRIRAEMEAILDFSDEADVNQDLESLSLSKEMSLLLKSIDADILKGIAGERLRSGIKIVLIGAPNVGKSSLINILLKEDRAIVSPEAGTTRDTIDARLNLEGIPVTIFDTAGIRKTENKIEEEGVKRTEKSAKAADIIVSIRSPEKKGLDCAGYDIGKTTKILKVVNKIDLRTNKDDIFADEISLSCKTKHGVDLLLKVLGEETKKLVSVSDMTIGPNRLRHIAHLRETKESLHLAIKELEKENIEIAADFTRGASMSLGRIIGIVDIEDVLDELFLGFCIGK
jgi:tRNA modification GTPase